MLEPPDAYECEWCGRSAWTLYPTDTYAIDKGLHTIYVCESCVEDICKLTAEIYWETVEPLCELERTLNYYLLPQRRSFVYHADSEPDTAGTILCEVCLDLCKKDIEHSGDASLMEPGAEPGTFCHCCGHIFGSKIYLTFFTKAPKAYDYSYTLHLEQCGDCRIVAIPPDYAQYQRDRYSSGLHISIALGSRSELKQPGVT